MRIALVIPARYGSSRFPGKPLAIIAGKSLLARTYAIAGAVLGVDSVLVATDDARVAAHAGSFGAPVLLTPGACPTGTDRVAAALAQMHPRPDAALNLQGDAVLTPPWVLQALVDALRADRSVRMVTAAVRLDHTRYEALIRLKEKHPTHGTTVTVDARGNALYFSKAIIPFVRHAEPSSELPPIHRHIGVYGYTSELLSQLTSLPQSPLEKAEGLEQLRALENGISIRVVPVDYRGRTHASVDGPADVALAEGIIAREGELVP